MGPVRIFGPLRHRGTGGIFGPDRTSLPPTGRTTTHTSAMGHRGNIAPRANTGRPASGDHAHRTMPAPLLGPGTARKALISPAVPKGPTAGLKAAHAGKTTRTGLTAAHAK